MNFGDATLREFIRELGSESPTPGGGSVAALSGALGAALSSMVAKLTLGREKFRESQERMERIERQGRELADRFIVLSQKDAEAYRAVLSALKLPKESPEEKDARRKAMQEAMKVAAEVPMETLNACLDLIRIAKEAVESGNPVAITDAGAAVHMAEAAAFIAAYNVRVNLSGIKDDAFVRDHKEKVDAALERIKKAYDAAVAYVDKQLP